jgi:hypothetical protein
VFFLCKMLGCLFSKFYLCALILLVLLLVVNNTKNLFLAQGVYFSLAGTALEPGFSLACALNNLQ